MKPIDFWSQRNISGNPKIRRVEYANGLFVAVGDGIFSSPDGINWTSRYHHPPEPVLDVVYTGTQFVAVTQVEPLNPAWPGCDKVLVPILSSDGILWTLGNATSNVFFTSAVASIRDVVVAVGNGIQTSQFGGQTWQVTFPEQFVTFFLDVCTGKNSAGSDLLVAVGDTGYGDPTDSAICAVSSDGQSWTERATGTNIYFRSVTYGNGYFVAVGNNRYFYMSNDGLYWTRRAYMANDDVYKITFGNNMFVAVGTNGFVYDSPDGDNWNSRLITKNDNFIDVKFGADSFIVVANTGNIYQSESYSPNRRLLSIEFNGSGKVDVSNSRRRPTTIRSNFGVTVPVGTKLTLNASGIHEQVIRWVKDPFGHTIPLPTGVWLTTVFERWVGPVRNPNSATIALKMDSDKDLTVYFSLQP
jgi:hypothetical protein